MAYFKITQDKKGKLQAKIQVSGRDLTTGSTKLFYKRIYNEEDLTEAKFRKQVEKTSIAFEEEVFEAYANGTQELRTKVLTFSELMQEWKATIKANLSLNYYERACEVEKRFGKFLEEQRLADKPISEIKVRDVQKFLNSFETYTTSGVPTAKMKKDLPKEVNFRKLARNKIITRCSSHYMKKKGGHIVKETALKLCEFYNLDYTEFFEDVQNERPYALETIKGYRRILRTVFNEAVRYEWLTKNPVCATKTGAGSGNTSLRTVPEKDVFSMAEAKDFIRKLDSLDQEELYKKLPIKFMLLTGVRNAEMCGLRWSDIDFEKKTVFIKRNRLYNRTVGIYEKEPKTKTSKREIPLTDSLIKDLKEYMEWFRTSDKAFDEKLDEYYLAVNLYRLPLYPQLIGRWLKEYERAWNVKLVTCHGLRHTYCSLLLSQNVPIQTVSKYMGHSDSTVTLKVYSHFIADTQDKAINALNNLIE